LHTRTIIIPKYSPLKRIEYAHAVTYHLTGVCIANTSETILVSGATFRNQSRTKKKGIW